MKYYTGIGSRETPKPVLKTMYNVAQGLYEKGWTLRSGGAPGADQAFEWGVADLYKDDDGWNCAEIYLPWKSFEKDNRSWIHPTLVEPKPEAFSIAQIYHPRFKYLSRGAKLLMARNTHQVYGENINNPIFSKFIICWTKDAKGGGGTGQAIRIANHLNIPVYDLADEKQILELSMRLNKGNDF